MVQDRDYIICIRTNIKNTAYATENTVVDSKADIVGGLTQVSPKVPEVNYMCITAIVLSIVFAIRICN